MICLVLFWENSTIAEISVGVDVWSVRGHEGLHFSQHFLQVAALYKEFFFEAHNFHVDLIMAYLFLLK